MHIPENYLSPSTCGAFAIVMVPIWARAIRHVRQDVPREKLPLVGIMAAFCFLAMMFNVPLPGGTTGHAVAGTLVAILFGPWCATVALSMAIAIQAFFFGDGGILALPANCFNMAFVLPMCGYAVYSPLMRHRGGGMAEPGGRRELLAAGIGSYVGINAAALCAAIEFGIQPLLFHDAAGHALYCPYPPAISIPAMMLGHLTIAGAAEALFTVGILAFVRKTAPDFGLASFGGMVAPAQAGGRPAPQGGAAPKAVLALMAALVVATPIGLVAAGDAWGEWSAADVAGQVGYAPEGLAHGWEWSSLLPDYSLGGLPDWAGYLLSAIIGTSLLVVAFRLLAWRARPQVDFDAPRDGA